MADANYEGVKNVAIRPKVGAKVGFNTWMHMNGQPVPPSPWTGEVVKVKPPVYYVKRDADGEVVRIYSSSLYYPKDF